MIIAYGRLAWLMISLGGELVMRKNVYYITEDLVPINLELKQPGQPNG